jgi:hypothetical protein
MASVTPTISLLDGVARQAKSITWETLTSTNVDGVAAVVANAEVSITITVNGTFGSATVIIQGSNDGTNWHTVKDVLGVAVSLTAAGMVSLSDLPLYIRPSTSGGGGTQDIDVTAIVR